MPATQSPGDAPAAPAWPHGAMNVPTTAHEWNQALGYAMQPGALRLHPRRAWRGSARTAVLAGGGVATDLILPALTAEHHPEHLPRAHPREALIHIVLEGAGRVQQAGRSIVFGAGDITFRDAQLPSQADIHDDATRLIALRLPLSRWAGCFPSGLNGPGIAPRQHELTQTVHGLLRQMRHCGASSLAPAATAGLEQAFAWALGATCCQFHDAPPAPAAPSLRVRRQQVHDYMDMHFLDPSLSPASCARALGISERYLHRALGQHGERFSQLLWGKRLDASAQRLRDPRFARHHIGSIAWLCGFQDPAHFSRAFATRFGVTPRVWRSQPQVDSER